MRLGADVLALDLYEILGVRHGASAEQMRFAYRVRARESHPDLNPSDPESPKRMVELNIAFRVLLDPTLRSAYEHGRRARAAATPSTQEAETRSRAWYERTDTSVPDWIQPERETTQDRARFRDFLYEVRGAEARWSLRLFELVSSAPARIQCLTLAACIAVAAGLIGWVGMATPQPISVDPNMLSP